MNRIPTTVRPPLPSLTIEEQTKEKYRHVYSYMKKQLHNHTHGSVLLNFKAGRISQEGAEIIANFLSSNPSLTEIIFKRTTFRNEAAVDLVKILSNNTTLTSLVFDTSRFNCAGFKVIAQALINDKTIEKLTIVDSHIKDDMAAVISEFLKSNTNLIELSLASNSIGDAGAKAISDALKYNSNLKKLDLSKNSICDQDASIISELIKFNSSLTEINFCNNNIRNESAIAIAEVLKFNTSLSKLYLDTNPILGKGIKHIADALLLNQTLTELRLSINIIDTAHFVEPLRDFKSTMEKLGFTIDKEGGTHSNIENLVFLGQEYDSKINDAHIKINNINNTDFLNAYITIQKICNRNKEKEILIGSARPVLKALAPQTPMEIADLLARELLVTESGAETLRRVGDLI